MSVDYRLSRAVGVSNIEFIDIAAVSEYLNELGMPLPTTLAEWIAAYISMRIDDEIVREISCNGGVDER